MAYSKSVVVTGANKKHKHLRGTVPPRTPGPTGHNDAGDPNCHASLGDTAGPLGHNDHGSPLPEARHRWGISYTGHRYPPGEKSEVWKKAFDFVYACETDPKERVKDVWYPCWPGGLSGVTWGVGWDARWWSSEHVKKTWAELDSDDLEKLAQTAKKKESEAERALRDVKDIPIPKDVAMKVYQDNLKSVYGLTGTTFPGFEKLPTGVQVALISLVYNRAHGDKMPMGDPNAYDRYWEMRQIQRDVANQDLVSIYHHLTMMMRLWKGGVNVRRTAECKLIKPYILEDLKAEADSVAVLSSLRTA